MKTGSTHWKCRMVVCAGRQIGCLLTLPLVSSLDPTIPPMNMTRLMCVMNFKTFKMHSLRHSPSDGHTLGDDYGTNRRWHSISTLSKIGNLTPGQVRHSREIYKSDKVCQLHLNCDLDHQFRSSCRAIRMCSESLFRTMHLNRKADHAKV